MTSKTLIWSTLFAAFAVLAWPIACEGDSSLEGGSGASSAGPGYKSQAAEYLAGRLDENDKRLYVYRDFSDGLNNFTQKAWMGDGYDDVPPMDEAAEGRTGVSGIAAELDVTYHRWGGYMFLNGSLKPGEIRPELDFGETDCGLDLTGAVKLVFSAKGETGEEKVEFIMGGLGWNGSRPAADFPDSTKTISLGVVSLAKEWKRYELDLAGVDLSKIGNGFGWVANDRNNPGQSVIKFYLDDIYYEFEKPRLTPLFLQSYASAKPGTDDSIINNFAYLYDNAAAALALSYAGENGKARRIADAILYALENDRHYSDGRLRNAYSSGDPRGFPGWFSGRGKEFARLPGFYDPKSGEWHEDFYAASTSTGNLAWAVLALCEVYDNAPEEGKYLEGARKIGDFILALKDDKGGFAGGYEGWENNEVKVTYKSAEHNIDLISAFARLGRITGDSKYAEASDYARKFVLSMFDPEKHCFYTGTGADGITINKEVLPLDSDTWAILALGESFQNGDKVLEFVENNMRVGDGYDFNSDKDGVWFEGTAQVSLAYKLIGNADKYGEILSFLNGSVLADGSLPAADRDGVSTGFMVSGTDLPWIYGKRSHVGATAWLAFSQLGRNPFE